MIQSIQAYPEPGKSLPDVTNHWELCSLHLQAPHLAAANTMCAGKRRWESRLCRHRRRHSSEQNKLARKGWLRVKSCSRGHCWWLKYRLRYWLQGYCYSHYRAEDCLRLAQRRALLRGQRLWSARKAFRQMGWQKLFSKYIEVRNGSSWSEGETAGYIDGTRGKYFEMRV